MESKNTGESSTEGPKKQFWSKIKTSVVTQEPEPEPFVLLKPHLFTNLNQETDSPADVKAQETVEEAARDAAEEAAVKHVFMNLVLLAMTKAKMAPPEGPLEDIYGWHCRTISARLKGQHFDVSLERLRNAENAIFKILRRRATNDERVQEFLDLKSDVSMDVIASAFRNVLLSPPKKRASRKICPAAAKPRRARTPSPEPKRGLDLASDGSDTDSVSSAKSTTEPFNQEECLRGQNKEERDEIYKGAVDKILKRLISQVLAQGGTKLDLRTLTFAYIRISAKVWTEMCEHEFDISPERVKVIHKAIFREICRNLSHIKEVEKFLLLNETMDSLIVASFKKILLSSQMKPKDKIVERIVPDNATQKTNLSEALASDSEDVRQIAVDFVLRKLINEAIEKVGTASPPDRLQEIHARLFRRIWAEVEGREFDTSAERLEQIHKIVFRKSCRASGAINEHLLTFMEVNHPRIDDTLASVFKSALLKRNKASVGRVVADSCCKAPAEKLRGMFEANVEQMEIEIKPKQPEPVSEELVRQTLAQLIKIANSESDMKITKERREAIHKFLFPYIWNTVKGGDFYLPPGKISQLPARIYLHYCKTYFITLNRGVFGIGSEYHVDFVKLVSCFKKWFLEPPPGQPISKVFFQL